MIFWQGSDDATKFCVREMAFRSLIRVQLCQHQRGILLRGKEFGSQKVFIMFTNYWCLLISSINVKIRPFVWSVGSWAEWERQRQRLEPCPRARPASQLYLPGSGHVCLRLAIGDLALVGEALKYELLLFYFVILLSLNCEYLCKVMQVKR